MTAETKQVTLEPGGTAEVEVAIQRNNEFGGRVPVEVRNLPPGVLRDRRRPERRADQREREPPQVSCWKRCRMHGPSSSRSCVSGKIETRADGQQNSYAAEPILLKREAENAGRGSSLMNTVRPEVYGQQIDVQRSPVAKKLSPPARASSDLRPAGCRARSSCPAAG